jgi:esterase/lipase superfamily enzyme
MTPRRALFGLIFIGLVALFTWSVLAIIQNPVVPAETPPETAGAQAPTPEAEIVVQAPPAPAAQAAPATDSNEVAAAPAIVPEPPRVPAQMAPTELAPNEIATTDATGANAAQDVTQEPYSEVTLFYATNRARATSPDPAAPTSQFTDLNAALTWGTAVVSIPRNHQIGHLETQGWLMSFIADPNPDKHVILQQLTPMSRADILTMAGQAMGPSDRSILLYVHGYNTSLDKAARRAGQLTYDLDWTGPSFFFSWPSRGQVASYTIDHTMADRSERALMDMLRDLSELDADRIVVIAHSMGTQILTQAMVRLYAVDPSAAGRITTIVLAAPDIDADVFIDDIMPVFRALDSTQVTLYASSEDSALKASHTINGFTRIGDTTSGVPQIAGVDMIDATGAESDFFGHTYFGDSATIISDIFGLVHDHAAPRQRATLLGVPDPDGPTWRIKLAP